MTPVLCLNCGKARSEHHAGNGDAPWFCTRSFWSDKHWLDGVDIEQRTVEAIATWLNGLKLDDYSAAGLAGRILSGAWKEKP